jgi:hypothetical protein
VVGRTDDRGIRIPLPPGHWWVAEIRAAADRRAERLGIRRPGLRDLARELAQQGTVIDEIALGRCVNGQLVTWEVALPLSRVLGVPPPAAIARTIAEAKAFENADELASLLQKMRDLKTKL